jgi:threonine dehydrogenase-like Zn-dependent dehydrogenase
MGLVDEIGPSVKHLKVGQRVVASLQIACGQCEYCKKGLSSFCDRTNNSSYVYSVPMALIAILTASFLVYKM